MRKPILAGNWKMNKTVSEAVSLCKELVNEVKGVSDREIVVCPPFTALSAVNDVINGTNVLLGAQNMYWELEGAYTGEVSPLMLKDLGVQYVIVGHSERREYFGETDEIVGRKARAALDNGLTPIICVGETLEQREAGNTKSLVESQIKGAFAGMSEKDAGQVVVAYEPIWAIGTGRTATGDDANEVCAFIRQTLRGMYGDLADSIQIQYGGSVKPANANELMSQSDIDGALVGGASLKAADFAAIVKFEDQ